MWYECSLCEDFKRKNESAVRSHIINSKNQTHKIETGKADEYIKEMDQTNPPNKQEKDLTKTKEPPKPEPEKPDKQKEEDDHFCDECKDQKLRDISGKPNPKYPKRAKWYCPNCGGEFEP